VVRFEGGEKLWVVIIGGCENFQVERMWVVKKQTRAVSEGPKKRFSGVKDSVTHCVVPWAS
jgi:hypothetical protein